MTDSRAFELAHSETSSKRSAMLPRNQITGPDCASSQSESQQQPQVGVKLRRSVAWVLEPPTRGTRESRPTRAPQNDMKDLRNAASRAGGGDVSSSPPLLAGQDASVHRRTRRRLITEAEYRGAQMKPSQSSMFIIVTLALGSHLVEHQFTAASGQQVAESSLAATTKLAVAPSQLFLPQAPQSAIISRVSGFYPKQSADEEEDGFIMQAGSGPRATTMQSNQSFVTVATASDEEEDESTTTGAPATTTTNWPYSAQDTTDGDEPEKRQRRMESSDQGSIPIDANRQQFLTHDQLNLNASTKDENTHDLHRAESSRADRSKVSHVSSFLSDLFGYATRARQPSASQLATSNQGNELTNGQKTNLQQASTPVPSTCPGVCRSILTASILCHNEISAPCPSLLQKCCDADDVSFNGTPVETSAPLTPADSTDPNPAPLSEQAAQAQELGEGERQTSTRPTASSKTPPAATSAPATTTTTTTTKERVQVAAATQQQQRVGPGGFGGSPFDYALGASDSATVYFLSSGNGSSATEQVEQQQRRGFKEQQLQNEGSLAQSAGGGKQSQQQHPASQSFDHPLNEQQITAATKSRQQQVVVVQTANGTLVHHSGSQNDGERLATKSPPLMRPRPTYANRTEYHLSIMQTRPSQSVVYHSNVDPVKRFVEGSNSSTTTLKPQATTAVATSTSDPTPTCNGVCMRKSHVRSCLVAASASASGKQQPTTNDLSSAGCALSDEFCCLQSAHVSLNANEQASSGIRRTMLVPSTSDSAGTERSDSVSAATGEIKGVKVMNDQHAASRDHSSHPSFRSPATTTTATTSTTTPQPAPTETPVPTTSEQPLPATTGESISLIGHVLGELFDSLVSSVGQSASTQAPQDSAGYGSDPMVSFADSLPSSHDEQPGPQQNDHRLGYDLSFRQQSSGGNTDRASAAPAEQAPQATTVGLDHDQDLMTSGDDSNGQSQPAASGDQEAPTCAGYCALALFSMLCDRSYQSADCEPNKKCCVIDRAAGGASAGPASDEREHPVVGADQQQQALPSTGAPEARCRGTCLPVYHSSLCTKPNELDSLGCSRNEICCSPPVASAQDQIGGHTTNQLDDGSLLVDTMMTGASGPSPGLDHQQAAGGHALFASLLPPPPPPVAQTLAGAQAASERQQGDINARGAHNVIAIEQQRQRQSHVTLPVDPTRVVFTQQPSTSTTVRPTAASKNAAQPSAGSGGGFINHIYQMFKSNGPSKQRQKSTQSPVQPQHFAPHLPSFGVLPQIDPTDSYLAHQFQQQQLHRAPPVQQAPQLIYPIQQAPGNLLFNPLLNNYQPGETDHPTHMQTPLQVNRNRVYPAQPVADQLIVSGHQMSHQQQRPFIGQQQQQSQNKLAPSQQHLTGGAIGAMSQFNEQSHLIGDKFAQNSEQSPTIVSFATNTQLTRPPNNGIQALQLPVVGNTNKLTGPNNNLVPAPFNAPGQTPVITNNERRFHQPATDNAQQLAATFNQQQPSRQVNHHTPYTTQAAATSPFGAGDASLAQVGGGQFVARPSPGGQSHLNQPAPVRQFQQQPQAMQNKHQQATMKQQHHQVVPAVDHQQQQQYHQRNQLLGQQGSRVAGSDGQIQMPAEQKAPAQAAGRPIAVSRPPGGHQQQPVAVAMSSVNRGGLQQPNLSHTSQQQHQVRPPQRTSSGSGMLAAPVELSNNQRQQPQQTRWQPPSVNDDDLNQQACQASCLAPMLSFNCVKPDYIDHNLICPTSGAACCVRNPPPATPPHTEMSSTHSQEQVDALEAATPPRRQSTQSVVAATSQPPPPQVSSISMVTSNKLDAMSLSDQLDDQMDEMSKQQQMMDSAIGAEAASSSHDLDSAAGQQPPVKSSRPATCGIPGPRSRASGARVMGGSDAKPNYWCWQAALMNSENEYLCGGALIGSKWVLTAAHCVTQHLRSESQLFVRLGQHNLNSSSADEKGRNILVKTTYVHHNHNGITLDNDIALLRLDSGAETEPGVCTVCLPERSSQIEPGKRCTVTGYGFEQEQGPAALRVRQTELPIVADQECQRKTSAGVGKPFSLPANSFCAGGELGQDACHGDGGSPLSCLVDGYYELTGIVSWGYKCGSKDLPGLYSKVSTFVGWINQIVSVNN